MVSTADKSPAEPTESWTTEEESTSHSQGGDRWQRVNRGGLRRLIASTVRLADLQLKIWLTHAKINASRILTSLLLLAVAGVMAILGTIFLLIGLFHILTDLLNLQPVWAFLIFATFLFAITAIFLLLAQKALNKKDAPPKHPH